MINRKYRVKPLGFTFFSVAIIITLIIASTLLRKQSAPNNLTYLVNKQINQEKTHFDFFIKVKTSGDIIEHTKSDYFFSSNILLNKTNNTVSTKNLFSVNSIDLPEFDALFTSSNIFFKSSELKSWSYLGYEDSNVLLSNNPSLDFQLDKLMKIINNDNEKIDEIISSNFISMKTHFNDYISYNQSNKNEIILNITLKEFYDESYLIIDEFLQHEYFKDVFISKYVKIFNLYKHNSILNSLSLNSRDIEASIVKWNVNFKENLLVELNNIQEKVFKTYNSDSEIKVTFDITNATLNKIELISDLKYNTSDAYENVEITVDLKEYLNFEIPLVEYALELSKDKSFYNYIINLIK